ncbi:hypothetical protein BCR41DRAFT_201216 [Lobosporangium transversale]|uniref:N-acetyltransferase domain-containing protein n=1 Tax=Lobosporangium transversale TaxID=64571 RepID=A0A1Y2GYJ9_9FUNG|nr:hypothetical protein BCR41DRAFT_201216 [Lobosporangium transversale]ORZ26553.1 hypothetical protein BCR41DRAFT_201216 [Lobosporangium transversale]|eukprot:XP_021884316.1 hypothetical protein BCR41DRAFT_201216 [Lobosporangium transversale]
MLSNLGTSTTHKKKQGRIITPLPMTAFYNKQYFISQFTSLHHDSTQPALIHQLLASGLQNTHSEFWILYDDDTHQPIACVGANTVMSDPSMGYVGLFEAKTEEAGVAVLNAAIEWLRHGGLQQFKPVRQILGPVNMTTWLQYRLRIDTEPQPSMSFEPRHPHFYDTCFSKAGFVKAMDYYSTFFHIDDLLEGYQAYTHGVSLESVGLILQPWNTLDFQASLNPEKHPELSSTPQDDVAKRLYDLSIGMFRGKEFFDEGFTRSNHRQVVLNDMVSRSIERQRPLRS